MLAPPHRRVRYLLPLFGSAVLALLALTAWYPGKSTAVQLSFQSGSLNGIIRHPTSLAFGPDGRLYVASETSVQALTLNDTGTRVTGSEVVASGLSNALGVAFDPTAPASPVAVYVSHQNTTATAGFQGVISRFTAPNWQPVDVITGLPTSEPYLNHMTNGMAFDGQGRLFIAQGSGSNAGLAAPGGVQTFWPETPLSGAILVADIHAAGFSGTITYSPAGPPSDYNVDQAGGDVRVFAPGLRNPYDLVLHSNGRIYATDNGPSTSTTSLTCAQEGGSVDESDKLNLIEQGNYYGFPNRNRGRMDPRQCTYHPPTEGSSASFTAPIAILPAHCSCDGIAEYTSGAFGGKMRGDLIIAQWVIGNVARVQLSGDGRSVTSVSTLAYGFSNPLDVTVGPTGIIYVADYGGDDIGYLQPLTPAATVTPRPSGTPTPTSQPTPTATQPPSTSTLSPTPTSPSTPTLTPTPERQIGDANCDGVVNAVDAELVLEYSARLVTSLPCQQNADVNGDGRIDAVDAALILQYVAGLLPALPA